MSKGISKQDDPNAYEVALALSMLDDVYMVGDSNTPEDTISDSTGWTKQQSVLGSKWWRGYSNFWKGG